MYKFPVCIFIFLCSGLFSKAQETESDTLKILPEVVVTAFDDARNFSRSTINVKIIETNNAGRNNKLSLVHGFNTIAGVRMEERSPGSYRINIRGSSIRSPFGVRNVKVYWNNIPVTDPGGNTYFNQIAYNNFSSIDIYNGPAGSMYGAGTGGLILMRSFDQKWDPGITAEYLTGSYNLQNILFSVKSGEKNNRRIISYAHNQTNGYRDHTKMRRDNLSWTSEFKIKDHQFTTAVLFTDLFYHTPGALTLAQFQANPKASRPAAGRLPSAVAAKAAIYQKNFLAGITDHFNIALNWTSTTTFYGAYANIHNPSIRNYERRSEPHFGGRTNITWKKKTSEAEWKWITGSEMQWGFFNTQVFKNKNGNPDTLQTNDDIQFGTKSFFTQLDYNLKDQWQLTAGVSLNNSKIEFTRLNKYPIVAQKRMYRNELAPRVAVSKILNDKISFQATIAKGFSPPTISELLPSTGVISTQLEAETGTNYEVGGRFSFLNSKLIFFLNAFYFKLNNALVQRRDLSGADYFINAGNTKQKGLEMNADYSIASFRTNSFLKSLVVKGAYAFSHFRYGELTKDTIDFSGKQLPSVPANTVSLITDLQFKKGFYCNLTHYYASQIFLNDANNASAAPYHLLGLRVGWNKTFTQKLKLNFYFGIDNLLNEVYSLGNDINDPRSRFFNAAPRRNYYTGLSFQWLNQKQK